MIKIFNTKKLILILIAFPLLSNCTQYSAMVNPSITLATGGTISQASTSLASSLAVKEAKKNLQAEVPEDRYCQTFHSSELNEIFFETIDQSNCIYDPMSIYR
tara:strand:- start:1 stop:309 length:309 start_codon:yes stop_codon:yes gene_type:complete